MNLFGVWKSIFACLLWLSLPGIFAMAQENADSKEEGGEEQTKRAIARNTQDIDEEDDDDEEDEEEMDAVQVDGGFGIEPEKMAAAKRFQFSQTLEVEIATLDRICKLEPEQKSKLQVGAKGTVKKLTAAWEKSVGQMFGGRMPPNKKEEESKEAEEKEPVEIKDVKEIDAQLGQFLMIDNPENNPFQSESPGENKIWKNLVTGVLTPDQNKTWSDFKEAQLRERRKAVVESVCAAFVAELQLTEDQSAQLKKLLMPHYENSKFGSSSLFDSYVYYYHATKVSDDDLKAFLSPAQVQKFRLFLLPMKEMGEMFDVGVEDENENQEEEMTIEPLSEDKK